MFGFSWDHILLIGLAALIFIGPSDIPRAMKTAAKWMSAGRKLAREFQSHVDDLVREAELDELRDQARKLATQPLSSHFESLVDPNREIAKAIAQSEGFPPLMVAQEPVIAAKVRPDPDATQTLDAASAAPPTAPAPVELHEPTT
jgi:sec-independent protein translocase protein TatB